MNFLGSLCMCACERGLLSNQDWLVGSMMLAGNWKRNTYFSAPYKALWFWSLSCRHACQGSLISHTHTHTHTHRRQSDSSLNSNTLLLLSFTFWMDAHPVLPVLFTPGINIRLTLHAKYTPKWGPKHLANMHHLCPDQFLCLCRRVRGRLSDLSPSKERSMCIDLHLATPRPQVRFTGNAWIW